MADAEVSGAMTEAPDVPVPKFNEQIEYMADMILEMQELAGQSGLTTLAGILALAHSEARLQIARQSPLLKATGTAPGRR